MTTTTKLHTMCPHCYGNTIRATDPTGDCVPKNGDIALCNYCGNLAVFCSRGTMLRKPTIAEGKMIASHKLAQSLRQSWQAAKVMQ